MRIDATPAWLKAHVDMLKPGSPAMVAFETAERVMRAAREREAIIELEREGRRTWA
jgi:hypothetical protein